MVRVISCTSENSIYKSEVTCTLNLLHIELQMVNCANDIMSGLYVEKLNIKLSLIDGSIEASKNSILH